MPSQSVLFKMPVKGVMKNPAFNDSPLDAAVDAVNVVPWDRTGRFRIGQRSGTAKLFAPALAASQTVQAMIQTTLALDPTSIVADQQLLNEQFNYSNGALTTVSGGVWTTAAALAGISIVQAPAVSSSKLQEALFTSSRGAILATPPLLGSAYVIRMACTYSTLLSPQLFAILFRVSNSTPGSTGFSLSITSNGGSGGASLNMGKVGATVATTTIPNGTLANGTPFTLELRVSGNVFTGWFNGSQLLSYTADSSFASNSGIGLAYSTNGSPSTGTFTVDDYQVFTGTAPANLRQTNIAAVCGGNVFVGTNAGVSLATSGTAALSATAIASLTYASGIVYAVDGFSVKSLNLTTSTVADVTATAGTLPSNCTLATVWRDRLVLAAPRGTPQNFFFSRVGVPTDFDYSQLDTAAAFAGNASAAGRIGEPIVALIPFNDDKLLIAGDHNLWMVTGDPADGGSIDLVSDAIGILGANAWTKAPDGTVYMVGTGGLYRVAPGGSPPENLSNKSWNEFFRAINRGNQYVTMTYDRDQQGLYVFVTHQSGSEDSLHLWWDARTEALWPVQFPRSHGPICALVYDGDGPDDRVLLLGSRDGYVRRMDPTAADDDGTAISSYVYLGPVKASNIGDSVVEAVDLVFGEPPPGFTEADWNVVVQMVAAPTIEKALNAPLYTRSRTFTASRRPARWLQRTRGNAFFLKFSNDVLGKTWTLESAQAQMTPTGLTRRR